MSAFIVLLRQHVTCDVGYIGKIEWMTDRMAEETGGPEPCSSTQFWHEFEPRSVHYHRVNSMALSICWRLCSPGVLNRVIVVESLITIYNAVLRYIGPCDSGRCRITRVTVTWIESQYCRPRTTGRLILCVFTLYFKNCAEEDNKVIFINMSPFFYNHSFIQTNNGLSLGVGPPASHCFSISCEVVNFFFWTFCRTPWMGDRSIEVYTAVRVFFHLFSYIRC